MLCTYTLRHDSVIIIYVVIKVQQFKRYIHTAKRILLYMSISTLSAVYRIRSSTHYRVHNLSIQSIYILSVRTLCTSAEYTRSTVINYCAAVCYDGSSINLNEYFLFFLMFCTVQLKESFLKHIAAFVL
jgi:hypothetical protein